VIQPIEIADIFDRARILQRARRALPLIVIGGLAAAASAFAVSRTLPPVYRATAQLYVSPSTNSTLALQDVILGQNLARTYAQMATAEVVLRPAMDKLGRADIGAFQDRTEVSQLRDTSIVNIAFKDNDPQRAADAANAIADSFIQQSRVLLTTTQVSTATQLDAQIASLQGEVSALEAQVKAAQTELAAPPAPTRTPVPAARVAVLQQQIADAGATKLAKEQTIAALTKTRDDVRLATTRSDNTVTLWQAAVAPADPESPHVVLNSLAAGLLGMLVALAAVAGLAYLDDRVRDADEVRSRLGLPLLAQIHAGLQPGSIAGKLFVRDHPNSAEAEAFRSLRTNILFADVDNRPRSIVVTSALPNEGKSVISANLALAFAEAGTPTVLIDADLRRPSQHRLFRVPVTYGLTNILTASAANTDLARFRLSASLVLIPSGPLPPNPAQLLGSARMSEFLRELDRAIPGAVIVIDTSPTLAVADAIVLAARSDGCLVVVDAGRTHARAARHAIDSISRVRANILGVVLNKISDQESYYYQRYSYYGRPATTTEQGARSSVTK